MGMGGVCMSKSPHAFGPIEVCMSLERDGVLTPVPNRSINIAEMENVPRGLRNPLGTKDKAPSCLT